MTRLLPVLLVAIACDDTPEPNQPPDPARGDLEGVVYLQDIDASVFPRDAFGQIFVELVGTSHATVTTPDGVYRMQDVPVGQYAVRASRPGYQPGSVSDVDVHEGMTTGVLRMELEPLPAVVTGSVVLADGSPAVGATVVAMEAGRATSVVSDGSFELRHLFPGTWDVEVSRPGSVAQSLSVTVEPEGSVELQPVTLVGAVGTVEGVIVSGPDGGPVDGYEVHLAGSGSWTNPATDGSWQIQDVPVGTYTVVLTGHPVLQDRFGAAVTVEPATTTTAWPLTAW